LLLAGAYRDVNNSAAADSILDRVERLPIQLNIGEQARLDQMRAESRHDLRAQLRAAMQIAVLDSSPSALRGVGRVAVALLRPGLAIPALERSYAATSVIDDADAARIIATLLGQALHQAGEHRRELRLVREQRAKSPEVGPVAGQQLRAYAGLGRGKEALALADTMAMGRPGTGDSNGNLLVFLAWGVREFRAHGDTATASQLLKIARVWMASHSERSPIPLRQYREGIILFASGMLDSADGRFLSAEHDPTLKTQAIGYRALASVIRGDRARAQAVADSLGSLSQLSGETEFYRAAIVGALGNPVQAVTILGLASRLGQSMNTWHDDFALASLHGYKPFDALTHPRR
jgi:hypothetical protein